MRPLESNNAGVENDLETLPDEVATALLAWRRSTLEREKTEALIYLRLKGENPDRTVGELKALVDSHDVRYSVRLKEAEEESGYQRLYERLLAAKRLANLRTAF